MLFAYFRLCFFECSRQIGGKGAARSFLLFYAAVLVLYRRVLWTANIEIYELPVVAKLSPISPGVSSSLGYRLLAAARILENTRGGAGTDSPSRFLRQWHVLAYLIAQIFGTVVEYEYQKVRGGCSIF